MIRKTLITLATVSALAVGLGAPSAKADSFDIGLGFGSGGITTGSFGFHGGGYGHGYGYYDDAGYDDGDCGYQMVKHRVWNSWHTHKITVWSKQWVCG